MTGGLVKSSRKGHEFQDQSAGLELLWQSRLEFKKSEAPTQTFISSTSRLQTLTGVQDTTLV